MNMINRRCHVDGMNKNLSIFLIFLCGLLFCNSGSYAIGQIQKITINEKKITLSNLFKELEKQTGLAVIIDNGLIIDLQKEYAVSFTKSDIKLVVNYLESKINNARIRLSDRFIYISSNSRESKIDSTPRNSNVIHGIVKDNLGNAMPGATIKIKNTNKGTTTDDNGSFMLSEVNKGEKIVISSIGFKTKEVTASNTGIIAELDPFINNLDETQVIAYGTRTKRFNTGNVTSVKASEIQDIPVSNPLSALQGRVPGLEIQPSSGLPGAGITIKVQGTNSLQSGNDPLIIVDNVPYPSQSVSLANNAGNAISTILGNSGSPDPGQIGSPLSYLNSGDIESIEVLKGADATSIYGSRAANGAILITTKRGQKGKTAVSFNIQSGIQKIGKRLNLYDGKEYLQMRHEALANDGRVPGARDFDLNGTYDTTISHDWQKELVGNTATNTMASIGISGGNENTTYLISGTYASQNYVYTQLFNPNNDRRGYVHANISSTSSNKRFTMQFSTNYGYDKNRLPTADYMNLALTLTPIAPNLLTEDGKLNWLTSTSGIERFKNPAVNGLKTYIRETNNIIGNLTLGFEIIPGLKISSNFGYTRSQTDETGTLPTDAIPPSAKNYQGEKNWLRIMNLIGTTWNVEPMITYYREIKKGKIDALLGSTVTNRTGLFRGYTGFGFSNDLLINDISSASFISTPAADNTIYKYNALFGRLNYTYNNKYIIQVTGRRDGSSRFGSQNRFHNFGSIAAAWIFSDENFVRESLPFIYFGKLRTSFGTTGNDQIGDYTFLTLYSSLPTSRPYGGIIGLVPTDLSNPFLQWEEVKKFEVGLELGLLENRVTINTNFALNRSSNQLMQFTLSNTSGFGSIRLNFPAKTQNKLWEISISSINIKKPNISWSTTLNLTIPNNKLISFPGLETSQFSNNFIIGKSITFRRLYKSAGVNDTTGVFQFYDSKGNITYNPDPIKDAFIILNTDPKLYGGIFNTVNYKGISLNIGFYFNKSNVLLPLPSNPPGTFGLTVPRQFLDTWHKPGDQARFQKYTANYQNYGNYINYTQSDAAYLDQFFLRCSNISLNWELPTKWKNSIRASNCSIYTQILNPFIITNNKWVLDPQTNNATPQLKTYNLGVKATF